MTLCTAGLTQGPHRPWMPTLSQLAALLLLPLLAWFALDAFDVMPRPGQQPVFPRVLRSSGITGRGDAGDESEPEFLEMAKSTAATGAGEQPAVVESASPPLPPPKPLDYWQKHLIVANATGLAPPVYRGNWMESVHGRMRWFEDDGRPRQMRLKTW